MIDVVLLEIFEQSRPGVPSSNPFVSTQLVRVDDGDFIELYPWPIWGKNFAQMTYWGNSVSDDSLVELIAAMVIRQALQLAVAFHFHFDAIRFGEDAEAMKDVRWKFWSAWDPVVTRTMQSAIDSKLRTIDATYSLFCDFLDTPRDPRFRDLLDSALQSCDLSQGYKNVMPKSESLPN